MTPPPRWLREEPDALVVSVHVHPGAKRTAAGGTHGDALRIRLAAPPVDGAANDELVRFLAEAFGVPKRQVTILHGATSRQKRVRIASPVRRPDREWGGPA